MQHTLEMQEFLHLHENGYFRASPVALQRSELSAAVSAFLLYYKDESVWCFVTEDIGSASHPTSYRLPLAWVILCCICVSSMILRVLFRSQ